MTNGKTNLVKYYDFIIIKNGEYSCNKSKFIWCPCVVNEWNFLPDDIVMAPINRCFQAKA